MKCSIYSPAVSEVDIASLTLTVDVVETFCKKSVSIIYDNDSPKHHNTVTRYKHVNKVIYSEENGRNNIVDDVLRQEKPFTPGA